MDAKELHDAYVKYGLAAIVGPDGVSPIVLRALSLLASAEGSSEEIVLELGGFVDFLHERGHDGDAQFVDDARARIVADAQEKERLRAELASVKGHAEAMRFKLSQHLSRTSDIGTVQVIEAYDAYRAARPKEGA